MDLKRIDLAELSPVVDKLPNNWDKFITSIPAKEGKSYRISSFSGKNGSHRVAVIRRKDGWYGKCECPGFPRTKKTKWGKRPCMHIAAALLVQKGFDPEEEFDYEVEPQRETDRKRGSQGASVGAAAEATKEARPDKEGTNQVREGQQAAQPNVEQEESPFLDRVDDASPLTRSKEVVERVPQAGTLVKPVATILETRAVFKAFQDAKFSLLEKTDVQRAGDKNFIKKSGWRKISVFFGLTLQKLDEIDFMSNEHRNHMVTYRAIAPGGQFQDATGYASWDEAMSSGRVRSAKKKAAENVKKNKWSQEKADSHVTEAEAKLEHDVRTTAETRAKNRAISDLVGGGEVSAEEMRLVGSFKEE